MNKKFVSGLLALSMPLSVSAADQQLELAVAFTDNMICNGNPRCRSGVLMNREMKSV